MIEAIIREYTDKHLYSTEIITLPEKLDENSTEMSLNILQ